mgnify:FL=1
MFDMQFDTGEDNVVIGHLQGKIDVDSQIRFKEELLSQFKRGTFNIVLDMNKLYYINSFGLGVLSSALKQARENEGDVKLADLHPNVLKMFQVTWLTKLFEIYPDIDSACQAFLMNEAAPSVSD